MFGKEEASRLRKEFWISFGKSFPRKWILYNTKIKDLSLKFYADRRKAAVMIAIEMKEPLLREIYYDKFLALKSIFTSAVPDLKFEKNYVLENGKTISRIVIEISDVSIYDKNTWQKIFEFFNENMAKFETIFVDYQDFIKNV